MADTETPARWETLSHDERMATLRSMSRCGGHFARHLSDAWLFADSVNAQRLAEAFPELLAKYGPGGPMHEV